MKINEIFLSVQGEGQQAGELTIFIRTSGCNFKCKWCDTQYHINGKEIDVEEIIHRLESDYPEIKNICLTGGEPLLQPDIEKFLVIATSKNYKVFVETNGSQPLPLEIDNVFYVLDFKLPSSGMYGKFLLENLDKDVYEIKFVIENEEDYDIAHDMAKEILTNHPKTKVLFSPCFEKKWNTKLAERIVKDKLPVRYSLQIHKVLWSHKKRGV